MSIHVVAFCLANAASSIEMKDQWPLHFVKVYIFRKLFASDLPFFWSILPFEITNLLYCQDFPFTFLVNN